MEIRIRMEKESQLMNTKLKNIANIVTEVFKQCCLEERVMLRRL